MVRHVTVSITFPTDLPTNAVLTSVFNAIVSYDTPALKEITAINVSTYELDESDE